MPSPGVSTWQKRFTPASCLRQAQVPLGGTQVLRVSSPARGRQTYGSAQSPSSLHGTVQNFPSGKASHFPPEHWLSTVQGVHRRPNFGRQTKVRSGKVLVIPAQTKSAGHSPPRHSFVQMDPSGPSTQ